MVMTAIRDAEVTATTAKALAVRTNSMAANASQNEHHVPPSRGSELAEQLNEETKQRYTKSVFVPLSY